MTSTERLRRIGLFEARAPRYTSYPPANQFSDTVGPAQMANWLSTVPSGARVSIYLHIPYCRRLCWFCACRTQGTATDRPLVPYLGYLKAELAIISDHLPQDVQVSQIHLGGGTPTLLSPAMLTELAAALRGFRPWARDMQFSVEIDPMEVDGPRIEALCAAGMTRASIGVQDFDPVVQDAIGRSQPFAETRAVVDLIRENGIGSLNMDILYGLPHQTRARMADSVQRVLSLSPDRIALFGYAHVPWMAKRQVMIPADALPGAEERLELFETARRLFVWDNYREIGIDHYARDGDSMAIADRQGALRRNFQGYTDDTSTVLIGLGASAISRFPQGYAQNQATSSRYAAMVEAGQLATERGHVMTPDDSLRADLIEDLMCRFHTDLAQMARRHRLPLANVQATVQRVLDQYPEQVALRDNVLRIVESPRLIARLIALQLDTYHMPEGRHSRAV